MIREEVAFEVVREEGLGDGETATCIAPIAVIKTCLASNMMMIFAVFAGKTMSREITTVREGLCVFRGMKCARTHVPSKNVVTELDSD